MQAVSGFPISSGSTGGCCACSASALCSLYPVSTPIPEVSTEEQILSLIELELGEGGRIRVSLRRSLGGPIVIRSGIRIIVRLTDGIGPLNPA